MAVYVDDYRVEATVQGVTARWSHLMADTSEELLAFADRLGLHRAWIQHPGTAKEHFDVTDRVRARALTLGAVPVAYGEAGHLTLAKARGQVFDLAAVRLSTPVEGALW